MAFELRISAGDLANEVKAEIKALNNNLLERLNEIGIEARKNAVVAVKKSINAPLPIIKESITLFAATTDNKVVTIKAVYNKIAAIDYIGTKEVAPGVSVKYLNNKPRFILKGAFIATTKSGHTGVFRKDKKRFRNNWTKGRKRTPGTQNLRIREMFAPNVLEQFEEKADLIIRATDNFAESRINLAVRRFTNR